VANVFPALSSGTATILSGSLATNAMMEWRSSIVYSCMTTVIEFVDSSEQRWMNRGFLFGATLAYEHLNAYDLSVLRNFWNQVKGGYVDDALANTFSIEVSGNEYNWCCFDGDDFEVEEDRSFKFSVKLKIRQLRPN
jgi:hypothetical protein